MEKERRIEKLLRAFAKKRKADAGAPLEMHPATRRLLQDEIARGTKKPRRKDASLWQMLFRTPRRAFVVCALMSLIISGSVFVTTMKKSRSSMELTKNTINAKREMIPPAPVERPLSVVRSRTAPAPAEQQVPALIPAAPQPAPGSPVVAGRKDMKEDADQAVALDWASNANGPMVASDDMPPKSSVSGLVQGQAESGNAALPAYGSIETQFKAPAVTSGSLAGNRTETFASTAGQALDGHGVLLDDSKTVWSSTNGVANFYAEGGTASHQYADKSNGQQVMQKFYRARQADALKDGEANTGSLGLLEKKQSAGEVLDSFSVQQDGNKITVVDSDGSHYTGTIGTGELMGFYVYLLGSVACAEKPFVHFFKICFHSRKEGAEIIYCTTYYLIDFHDYFGFKIV